MQPWTRMVGQAVAFAKRLSAMPSDQQSAAKEQLATSLQWLGQSTQPTGEGRFIAEGNSQEWIDAAALIEAAKHLTHSHFPTPALETIRLDEPGRSIPLEQLALDWEHVLTAYDQAMRRRHGAFFTPLSLARFITNATISLLDRDFPEVMAEPSQALRWVDPAMGSGILLLEALAQRPSLAGSLRGWELMPATAMVAEHLMQMRAAEVDSQSHPQVQWGDALQQRDGREWFPSKDAPGATSHPALVVIGNPPYSNFASANSHPWIITLLQRYKAGLEERKHNLHDDFIKFFRWAHHQVELVGRGIVAFITNSTHLRGITHRVMRRSLMDAFDEIYVLELGGEQFQQASGVMDENVFEIRQGVSITILVRRQEQQTGSCRIWHARWRGTRDEKFARLDCGFSKVAWERVVASGPQWRWSPQTKSRSSGAASQEYDTWPSLVELVRGHVSGLQSKRDALFIDRDRDRLGEKVRMAIANPEAQPNWLAKKLATAVFDDALIQRCQVAPMDRRWLYYDPSLLGRARGAVMRAVSRGGGLVFMRQSTNPGDYDHFLMCDCVVTDRVFHSRHGAPFVAPRWIYEEGIPQSNLTPAAWRLTGRSSEHDVATPPEEIWSYIYALVSSTRYRREHASQLADDFPRIAPAVSHAQFKRLASMGQELIDLHSHPQKGDVGSSIMDEARLTNPRVAVRYPQVVEQDEAWTTIAINGDQQLRLSSPAWSWRVGGVQVLHRWLSQRRDGPLTPLEWSEWRQLQQVAQRTLELVAQIDAV